MMMPTMMMTKRIPMSVNEIESMAEVYPFLSINFQNSNCELMIFEGSLIFTDVKFDYRTTVLETWNAIESIQNRRWIEMNWNPELEKKTKSIRERLEQEQAEIDRKISIHENFEENKASTAEMAEYFTIITEFLTLQNNQAENKNWFIYFFKFIRKMEERSF